MRNSGDYKQAVADYILALNELFPFRHFVIVSKPSNYHLLDSWSEQVLFSCTGPKTMFNWLEGYWYRCQEEDDKKKSRDNDFTRAERMATNTRSNRFRTRPLPEM